jgi:hypothetical protein
MLQAQHHHQHVVLSNFWWLRVLTLHLPVAAYDSQHPTASRPRGGKGSIGDGHEDALPDAPDHGHCTSNGEPS